MVVLPKHNSAPSTPESTEVINGVKHLEGFVPAHKIAVALTGAKKFNVLKVNGFMVRLLLVASEFQFLKIGICIAEAIGVDVVFVRYDHHPELFDP